MEVSQEITPTVAKLRVNGTEDIAYIIAYWSSDVNFKIIHNDKHWNSKFTKDEITYFYSNLCISEEEYMTSTREALSKNFGTEEFVYRLENDKFVWEKIVNLERNLKVTHGTVNLTDLCPQGGMEILIDTLLTLKQSMDDKLCFKEEEVINISKSLTALVEKFINYTALKIQMEDDFFEKVTAIINTKKQKIKTLEDFLKEIKTCTQTIKQIPVPRKKKTTLLPISDSDST